MENRQRQENVAGLCQGRSWRLWSSTGTVLGAAVPCASLAFLIPAAPWALLGTRPRLEAVPTEEGML